MSSKLQNIIIVYDRAYITGGAGKVAINSAILLSQRELNVYYFCAIGPIDKFLEDSKVKVECLDMEDILHIGKIKALVQGIYNNKVYKSFYSFLENFRPEDTVIHFHGWTKGLSSSVMRAAQKKHFKMFVTLHDYFCVCPNGGLYNYKSKEICEFVPMSASCIFCNCDKRNLVQKMWRVTRQIVQNSYVKNNKELIYISISQKNEDLVINNVKSNHFIRINNPVDFSNQQIEDCSKSNIFLYVGRLSDEKGADLFCKAVSLAKEKCCIEGVVVGDGPLLNDLKKEYSSIQFEGWKSSEEVKKYILQARMLILPSRWYEGAPLTIIEAMSAGLPCIISDCTSAVELIQDGINGYIFRTGDENSLLEKILLATDDKTIRNIQKNITNNFDKSEYSEQRHIQKLISVYEENLQ